MKTCPYPECNNNFVMEYSTGSCPDCKRYIIKCPNCGGYDRELAKFCRLCGKAIDDHQVEQIFYTRKLQKTPHFILNKIATQKLSFVESENPLDMCFFLFSGNKAIITSPNGYLYEWDFITQNEISKRKIPNASILIKPLLLKNSLFFASQNKVFLYNLLNQEMKEIELGNPDLSIVAIIKWQQDTYTLFKDTNRNSYVFGKINMRSNELDEYVEIPEPKMSANILPTENSILLFSEHVVYVYSKKDGSLNIKAIENFPKRNLNIFGTLYYDSRMNLLYIPEKTNIMRFNMKTGKTSTFVRNINGDYYVEFTDKRVIVVDDNGLRVFDYSEREMVNSKFVILMKNISFNSQPYSMKVLSNRLLFTFAFQSQGGGFIVPWMLDNPRVVSSISQISNSRVSEGIQSNIDVSRNYVGFITSEKEAEVWQF